MNTNIITQLAKVIGPETKESFAVIKKDRGALHSIKMGLATAVLFASGGMATAQQPYAAGANQYYGLYAPAQYAPGFRAQITFDTITRERVAARVSAQSPAITNTTEMAFATEK
jgi:hypothetical protein